MLRMEIKAGTHQLPARDDGLKVLCAAHVPVSHLYQALLLLWIALTEQTVSARFCRICTAC